MTRTEDREWSVMVGILHGLGQCFWEESGGQARRISHLFVSPQGQIGLSKAIIGGLFVGLEQIPIHGMVVFSVGATDEQQKNFHALWSNIALPQNGGSRFRLDK